MLIFNTFSKWVTFWCSHTKCKINIPVTLSFYFLTMAISLQGRMKCLYSTSCDPSPPLPSHGRHTCEHLDLSLFCSVLFLSVHNHKEAHCKSWSYLLFLSTIKLHTGLKLFYPYPTEIMDTDFKCKGLLS